MRGLKPIVVLLYVLVGFYFINLSIKYYTIPEIVSSFNDMFFLVAGLLLIFGGINSWRVSRHRKHASSPQ